MNSSRRWNFCVSIFLVISIFDIFEAARPKPRHQIEISIIGAGIAGLAAADKLHNYYFTNVTIFEALDRVGGRVHPIKYDDSYLQMGAEYVHGSKNNPMYQIAKQLKALEKNILSGGKFVPLCGNPNKELEASDLAFEIIEEIQEELYFLPSNAKGSYGRFMRKRFDAKLMSLRQWLNYNEFGGESDVVLNNKGYKLILDYFLDRLPVNTVQYNSHVTKIDWSKPKIKLTMKDGTVVESDHVIVTSSLGYLKKNAKTLFKPQLPKFKRKIIKAMGYGAMEKLFLEFPQSNFRFNHKKEDWIALLEMENCYEQKFSSPLADVFWSFSPEAWSNSVLLAWISGKDPERLAKATDKEIFEAAVEVIKRYFPGSPTPSRIIRSTWLSDPLFLGSYSYYSQAAEYTTNPQHQLARPVRHRNKGMIQFAGEATQKNVWQTTHGAMMSGWREAKRLNKIYAKKR